MNGFDPPAGLSPAGLVQHMAHPGSKTAAVAKCKALNKLLATFSGLMTLRIDGPGAVPTLIDVLRGQVSAADQNALMLRAHA